MGTEPQPTTINRRLFLGPEISDFSFAALAWTIVIGTSVVALAIYIPSPFLRYGLVLIAGVWAITFIEDLFLGTHEYSASEYAYDVLFGVSPWQVVKTKYRKSSSVGSGILGVLRALAFMTLYRIPFVLISPLVFLLLHSRIGDHAAALEIRKHYLDSFKTLFLVGALFSLTAFALKLIIYGWWTQMEPWWRANMSVIDPFFVPTAFYPWHFTVPIAGLLLFIATKLIDHLYSVIDAGEPLTSHEVLLFSLRSILRLRSVLSIYNWVCLLWLATPFLAIMSFPPVNWQMFPK